MNPNKEEVGQKHQEACMDEQVAPGQTQAVKGDLQWVEARPVAWEGYRHTVRADRDKVGKAKALKKEDPWNTGQ